MSLAALIQAYGYPALLLGAFLEGETIVVLAGFAAHRGYLSLPWVIVCAVVGAFTSDELFFVLGRTRGRSFIQRRPAWSMRAEKVHALLDRHQTWIMIGFRFFYGLRNVTPFVIGASRVDWRRFIILNATGAVIWAAIMSSAGYLFGEVAERLIENVRRYELWLVGGLGAAGIMSWSLHYLRSRRAVSQADRQISVVTTPSDGAEAGRTP